MKRILLFMVCIFLLPAIFVQAGTSDKNAQLIQAAEKGNIQEVQNALTDGADINIKDAKGLTSLMLASYKGHTDVVKLL